MMGTDTFGRRRFLQLSAVAAVTGAITACGGSPAAPSPAVSGPATTPTAAAPTAPAAAPTAPALAVSQATATPATATASKQYKESAMLAERVKGGGLPPVEQRLPRVPRSLKPLDEVGQHGGTWRQAYRGISDRFGVSYLCEEYLIEWDVPEPNTIRLVANVVERWEQNSSATEFTFHLRQGMRWSDGSPVTTEDVRFWWEDVQLGLKELVPAPNFAVQQRIGSEYKSGTLTVVDETTFKIAYQSPYPLLPITIAKRGGDFLLPAAYLKRFHPKYIPVEQLTKIAAEKKVATWQDLWGKPGQLEGPAYFWFTNTELPTLRPWKIAVPNPADPIIFERNPFYWQVDTEGNQLPYIDRISLQLFENNDVLNLRIAGGQIDMQGRSIDVGSYTFLKENEQKGNYRVLRWRAASTDAYYPNVNCPDKVLAKLFDTPDFRQALSLAINRKDINDLAWSGLGKPRQASPIPGSPEYDAELEQTWAEYDPTKANALLDGLGLTKKSDGTRTRSDGKTLEVTVQHISVAGSAADDAHQRVKKYWEAIGVKTVVTYVDRSLYEQRNHNGEVEIGFWSFDRCSVVKADPGRWLGTIDDGPWAPNYGHWYDQNSYKREEPPADHPIREIWKLWEQTQLEPDEAKRNALFKQLLGVHKKAPYAIGVVGEKVAPIIVSNAFRNVRDGYIWDDTLRGDGVQNPQQFFIKK
jgi:peptide/nickel transport system substrate-binding protein